MDNSRERDQSVERLLRQSLHPLRAPNGGVTDSCLDAETLAAWVDGGLSGAALETARTHVADCARCQSLVGALARVTSAVPQAVRERPARRWLAWLVPLTAAAAVVGVWIAVPHNELGEDVRLPPAAEVQGQGADAKAKTQEPASQADQFQASARENSAERPLRTIVPDNDAKKEVGSSIQLEAQMRRDAAPMAPAASALQAPGAPAAAAAPSQAAANALDSTVAAGRLRAEPAGIEIVSPDPMVRWRIAGSVVQRSTTGGANWADVPTGVAAELTAGAAPSASVCWVVGRGGVVLVSTDGRSWRRVAFPEITDLSGVRARDDRAVSVSTADGRTFSTTDGGATWAPRPLQDF